MICTKFKQLILPAYFTIFNAYANTTDLQLMLNNLMKSQDVKKAYVSGIPLTVQYSSKNISTLASGTISHEPNAQSLPVDAIFQAGSITKTFIGVLSVKLATQGYFGYKGLDSTVCDILGNQPSTISWNSKWNAVKLRQLINYPAAEQRWAGENYPPRIAIVDSVLLPLLTAP